jgi:adenylyltransferase/sulfurtransferase
VAALLDALPDGDPARPILVDVREPREWDAGHIAGATLVPLGRLAAGIGPVAPDPGRPVVLYCAVGERSLVGARILGALGYRDVGSMAGGIGRWRALGLPTEEPGALTAEQRARYARHLVMPEVGPEGQRRLLDARVLIVGAGGLGSPAALYLAAAGVGTIELVDFDVVDLSNLQRQVIHSTDRVGRPKVESARLAIEALNPGVRVVAHEEVLSAANVGRLLAGCDVAIDGTDSFETRYVLNDAAVEAGVPVVHASVFRSEGQVTVLAPPAGPCYRCLYPSPPPPELSPGCSVAGVLGVVPGIMGLLQANEALKLILGIGDPLVGRLLLFDALEASFSEVRLRGEPTCPACGEAARAGR